MASEEEYKLERVAATRISSDKIEEIFRSSCIGKLGFELCDPRVAACVDQLITGSGCVTSRGRGWLDRSFNCHLEKGSGICDNLFSII